MNHDVLRKITTIRWIRFLAVGVCTSAVDFTVLGTLNIWVSPTAAFSAAYAAAMVTHFLLNKHWTFRCGREDLAKQIAEYLVVVGITYLVQLAGFRGGLILCHQNVYLAKVLAVPPATVVGYCLLKARVFKDLSEATDLTGPPVGE